MTVPGAFAALLYLSNKIYPLKKQFHCFLQLSFCHIWIYSINAFNSNISRLCLSRAARLLQARVGTDTELPLCTQESSPLVVTEVLHTQLNERKLKI